MSRDTPAVQSIATAALFGLIAATICLFLTRSAMQRQGHPVPSAHFYVWAYLVSVPILGAAYWFVTR